MKEVLINLKDGKVFSDKKCIMGECIPSFDYPEKDCEYYIGVIDIEISDTQCIIFCSLPNSIKFIMEDE